MNIQRFALPASLAAAFHAVLLCAFTAPRPPLMSPTPTGRSVPPPPETPPALVEPVPADASESDPMPSPSPKGVPQPEPPEIFNRTDSKPPLVIFENSTSEKLRFDKTGPRGALDGIDTAEWTGKPPRIYRESQLDKVPRALVQIPPDYPAALKHDNVTGVVLIEFDVDVKGRVVGARVRESTRHAFDEPTVCAVLQWRFEPGICQGRPVPFRMMVPVDFKLPAD
jgi:protein TonB